MNEMICWWFQILRILLLYFYLDKQRHWFAIFSGNVNCGKIHRREIRLLSLRVGEAGMRWSGGWRSSYFRRRRWTDDSRSVNKIYIKNLNHPGQHVTFCHLDRKVDTTTMSWSSWSGLTGKGTDGNPGGKEDDPWLPLRSKLFWRCCGRGVGFEAWVNPALELWGWLKTTCWWVCTEAAAAGEGQIHAGKVYEHW